VKHTENDYQAKINSQAIGSNINHF